MLGTHSVMMGHCFPTREDSSLDHIMLKLTHDKVAQIAVLNTTITDHTMVLLHITNVKPQLVYNKTKCIVDFEKAIIDLKNKNIHELLLCNDPNVLTELLLGKLMQSLKENTGLLLVPKCKRIIKPWMTPGVLRCVRHRNNLQQKLRQNPNDEILRISY
ncbi:unnamed protein product [Parnassius apollo]|uniref:(apollo) hypothetical protein n=1 Tax=Parnassius apollo TaxID=110799 RepID=A0A8S3X1C5_PARAO|nr:unnamed protein product [Parnassius apollo]